MQEPERDQRSRPALVAHRGCARENPENTVSTFETAARVADAVEVDVRRCGTGELVAFHDARLGRLTDARSRIQDTSLATLQELDVGDYGETIPSLDAVLDVIPAHTGVVLDLKEPGLVDDLLALHAEYDHDRVVSSVHPEVLTAVRDADASIPTAIIVEESLPNRALSPLLPGAPGWLYLPEDTPGFVERAHALDCDAIHPRLEICLQTDLVPRAHDAGLHVRPWTITTQREYDALRDVGVDAVISDICTGLER